RVSREFEIPFDDREALLVDFLSELLFYGENDNIGFDEYQLDFDATVLEVRADGALIEHHDKGIKAVTFHQLEIRPTERGLEVNIVFDV
ncbi:MAG: archease, partial [Chloroflexota bacterium]|nr:archease [Chloroflexota bacterium]